MFFFNIQNEVHLLWNANMHVLLLLIYIQNWLSVQSWPPLPLEPASPPARPYRNSPSDSWSSPPPYSFLAGTWQKTLSLAAYLVTSLCQHCHYTKRKYHLLYLFHKLEVLSAITSYIEGGGTFLGLILVSLGIQHKRNWVEFLTLDSLGNLWFSTAFPSRID